MKSIIILILIGLVVLSSCSTVEDQKSLSEKINTQEVRPLEEVRSRARLLLESHPELDEKTKKELKLSLDMTLNRYQQLKDEESKIVQLLLSKSLRVNQLTDDELKDKKSLKKRLKDVYQEKSKNLLELINKIVGLSEKNVLNESFRNDMMDFVREMR